MRLFANFVRPALPSTEQIERQQHGPCLLCGEDLIGHNITQIASVIVDAAKSSKVGTLDAAVRARAWRSVVQLREWRGDADAVVYYAIRCPWSYQFYVSRLESFASMDVDDRVSSREVLSETDSALLASEAGIELHVLPTGAK